MTPFYLDRPTTGRGQYSLLPRKLTMSSMTCFEDHCSADVAAPPRKVTSPWLAPGTTYRVLSTPLARKAFCRISVWLGETSWSALPCSRTKGGLDFLA